MPTAANNPLFSANQLSALYGNTLTSQPNAGQSGTSGAFGSLGALPGVGTSPGFSFSDIYLPQAQAAQTFQEARPQVGTPASEDFRPALARGARPPAGQEALYAGLLDASGKAINAVPVRGTPASSNFQAAQEARLAQPAIPQLTSRAAITAYGLAERALQETAAKTQENRERGNAILAGYDQSIANNRALADQFQPGFDASQAASLGDVQGGYAAARASRDAYQPQFEAAQAAALGDLQSGYGTAQDLLSARYGRNMDYVNQYGDSMRSDLMDQYQRNLAASNQSAIRRGLGNTTIRDSLNRGVNSDFARNNLALEDRLLSNRLATDQALSGDYANSVIAGAQATAGQRNLSSQAATGLRNNYVDTLVSGGLASAAQRDRNLVAGTQLREANLGRENQGVYGRLGFLSSIQNDYPTSADYGNYLLQSGVLQETVGSRK